MDFLLGAAVIVPLVAVNKIMIKMMRRADASLGLAFAFGMFALGLMICLSWLFAFKTEADNNIQFTLGIGMGIITNVIYKINYVIESQDE